MQLSKHIHAIRLDYRVTPKPGLTLKRFVYVYWALEKEAILIDAGVKGTQNQILQSLLDLGYELQHLKHIVLTHAHADHIGALSFLQKETQAQIGVHAAERSWVQKVEEGLRLRPGRGMEPLVTGSTPVDYELIDGQWLESGDVAAGPGAALPRAFARIGLFSDRAGRLTDHRRCLGLCLGGAGL